MGSSKDPMSGTAAIIEVTTWIGSSNPWSFSKNHLSPQGPNRQVKQRRDWIPHPHIFQVFQGDTYLCNSPKMLPWLGQKLLEGFTRVLPLLWILHHESSQLLRSSGSANLLGPLWFELESKFHVLPDLCFWNIRQEAMESHVVVSGHQIFFCYRDPITFWYTAHLFPF